MAKQIIDIFLFIDPLGKRCNNVRKIIKKFREERPEKINLRIIPIVNSKRVYGRTRKQCDDNSSFVEKNNQFSTNTYQACLAFHASAMQGRRVAHQFLTALQTAVVEENFDFSEELLFDIAKNLSAIDEEMFKENYHSEFVKKIYQKNLKLASEMRISKTPSCVIIKNSDDQEAVRLDKQIEKEVLHSICGLKDVVIVKNKSDEEAADKPMQKILKLNAL